MTPSDAVPRGPAAEADSAAEAETAADDASKDDSRLVPKWLAVLVLVLLVSVVAVGGFIVRGIVEDSFRTPEEREVARWEEQVAQRPSDPRTRTAYAYALQRAKLYDQALEQYRQVLESEPNNTAALYNSGMIYRELGLMKQAERTLWDVLENDPNHTLAAKALGELYVSQRHYKSVIVAVRPVVRANPEMADLQYLMGLAYERLGRSNWALARYFLALKYAPDLKEARDGARRIQSLRPDLTFDASRSAEAVSGETTP